MSAYTYILQSMADGTYYVGATQNLPQRLAKHNSGATTFTRTRRPWQLVYAEEYPTKTAALQRELQIKRRKSRLYIEQLIRSATRIDLKAPPS